MDGDYGITVTIPVGYTATVSARNWR